MSDGNKKGDTREVVDAVLNELMSYRNLTIAGDKLFLSAYSYKFGYELYATTISKKSYANSKIAANTVPLQQVNSTFDITVFPNPTQFSSSLRINGNNKNIGILITDMSGKVVWRKTLVNLSTVNLPMEKFSAGIYMVTVNNGLESKTIKVAKQ